MISLVSGEEVSEEGGIRIRVHPVPLLLLLLPGFWRKIASRCFLTQEDHVFAILFSCWSCYGNRESEGMRELEARPHF